MSRAHVSWGTRRPIKPLQEIREFHFMLNANIRNRYLHDARTLRDPHDPFISTKSCEAPRDSLVQCGRHDLDRVRDAVHILNRDSARAEGHKGKLSYSLFVRHREPALPAEGFAPTNFCRDLHQVSVLQLVTKHSTVAGPSDKYRENW